MAKSDGGGREDERLEILFGWLADDSQHGIESGLTEQLDERSQASRRRRLPWPGRRDAHPG